MKYVYSTLALNQNYALWEKDGDGKPLKVRDIFIKGGAQLAIASANEFDIITPLGMVTRITDEEAEMLDRDFCFNVHRKNGFIRIEDVRHDVDKVVSGDMQLPDENQGAPLSSSIVKNLSKEKGVTIEVIEEDK